MPNIVLYLVLLLGASNLFWFGAYHFKADKVDSLQEEVVQAKTIAEDWRKQFVLVEQSTKADCAAATAMLEDKVQIGRQAGSLVERLRDVYSEPQYPSIPQQKQKDTEAPVAPDEVNKDEVRYADLDVRLHPTVGVLLDEAYCTATTDCREANSPATTH